MLPAPPSPSSPPGPPAGVGRRAAARLVDGLVLVVPVLALTAPISGGFLVGTGNVGADQVAATFFALVFCWGYFVVCEATRGATLGKGALRLQVRSAVDARWPTITRAGQRHAFMFVAAVPGDVGGILTVVVCVTLAVSIAVDPLGRGLHDRWAAVAVTR